MHVVTHKYKISDVYLKINFIFTTFQNSLFSKINFGTRSMRLIDETTKSRHALYQ